MKGEPPRFVLRLATAAPDGTAWAREFKALARDVESETGGEVRVKWYFGGIAGDERQIAERTVRGQLDGGASGGVFCQAAAPTYRVASIRGLFGSREEAAFIMNRLKPTFEAEARKNGYEYVAATGLGPDLVFSREPVRTLDELRRTRLWGWDIDEVGIAVHKELGLSTVPLPVEEGLRAYEEGRIDGFISNPSGAVAFQWFSRTRYMLNMPLSFSWGCLMVASRAFDRLSPEHRAALRAASAKFAMRVDEVGRQQDAALLGGVFERQGLQTISGAPTLRSEFLAAARLARERLGDKLIPQAVLQQVLAALADYRSEHR